MRLEAIMNRYFPNWDGNIVEGSGGWNNTTYFIEHGIDRYVLRIYAHSDQDSITFEHAVLEALQSKHLNFKVPAPVRTMTGESIVRVEDGSDDRYACLFTYIEGLRPEDGDDQSVFSFGESAAQLSIALATIHLNVKPVYRPYYELQHSYPECSREVVHHFCNHPPNDFADLQDALYTLGQAHDEICRQLSGLEKLPQQLVHGDLNFSNLLVDESDPKSVIALLDFEFCTWDVRVMEPAVILSGLLGMEGEREREAVEQFCKGYGSKIRFTEEELEATPVLMRLRKIDVFLHFMNRYFNGTDDLRVLRHQIQALAADLLRLDKESTWIEGILRDELFSQASDGITKKI